MGLFGLVVDERARYQALDAYAGMLTHLRVLLRGMLVQAFWCWNGINCMEYL